MSEIVYHSARRHRAIIKRLFGENVATQMRFLTLKDLKQIEYNIDNAPTTAFWRNSPLYVECDERGN